MSDFLGEDRNELESDLPQFPPHGAYFGQLKGSW